MPWCINKVDLTFIPSKTDCCRPNCDASLSFLLKIVHGCRSFVDVWVSQMYFQEKEGLLRNRAFFQWW